MAPHFEIYPERTYASDDKSDFELSGLWRWRFIAGNGENTANGSEGYANKGAARHAVRVHCEHVVELVAPGVAVVNWPQIVVVGA